MPIIIGNLAWRDRHSRGLVGPLIPHTAPNYLTPSQTFEKLLDLAIEDFSIRLGSEFDQIEITLEEIPSFRDLALAEESVPLGRLEKTSSIKVVIYQKPIEIRCKDLIKLDRLIRDTLAELIGLALVLRPSDVDPEYEGRKKF